MGFAQGSTHPTIIGRLALLRPSMANPVEPSLRGAYARTTRAHEHILDLIARISDLRQKQQDACSWEWDTDHDHLGEPKLVVSQYVQIPTEIGILIGEICYNLRSAFDYLVYELAIRAQNTLFPERKWMCSSRSILKYRSTMDRR